MPFSAILLSGGKSSRMGQDKASLSFEGEPLWRRQLRTLRALDPDTLFISGPATGPYHEAGLPVLPDPQPGLGPLAGIVEGLHASPTPHLLVLAIDLPGVNPHFLRSLLEHPALGDPNRGVVPRGLRWWHPLAAIYPRALLPLVRAQLASPDRSLQSVVRQGVSLELLESIPVEPQHEATVFRNLNTPKDLASTPEP